MTREPTVTPTLLVIKGMTKATSYVLDQETTVLGRLPECGIVLNEKTVSKRHAQIVRQPDGFYLEDLKSRAHTYVDGRLVERPVMLRDGSTIRICDFQITVSLPTVALLDEDAASSSIVGTFDASSRDLRTSGVRTEEKLRALMEIGHDLAGTLELKGVLANVLDTLFRIFPQADRGFVLLKGETAAALVPSAIKSRRADTGHLTISRTIFDNVMEKGHAVLSADAMGEFGSRASIVESKVRTFMCVPLWDRQRRTTGILQLDTSDRQGRFDASDLDLLAAVADQVSVAVEVARLHADEVRRRAIEQEARDARDVQDALLPHRKPQLQGYAFWDHYEPARFVGGDYYDYVPHAPGEAPNRWAIAVGDVMGKGMPAALLMARLSTAVRLLSQFESDPARLVTRLNRDLCEVGTAERFVTFLLVVLDGARHELTVVNAGHMGPLLRRSDGRVETIASERGGPFLTLDADHEYESVTTSIGSGDVVVLSTDGVSEAMNRERQLFGQERLEQAVAEAPKDVGAVGTGVLAALRRHTAGCDQSDDITLLCFGRE